MGIIKGVLATIFLSGITLMMFLLSQMTLESSSNIGPPKEENKREKSICFIMGEDKPGYEYFTLAKAYYLQDENEKTDRVVSTCRSIEEIILYLNEYNNQEPWSTIEVVLHGNPYSGLSTKIRDGGLKATPKHLLKSTLTNDLPRLEEGTINASTNINFWACGIGKNPFINMALDSFFQSKTGERPQIYTSPHFVVFKQQTGDSPPRKLKASYWPYIYKRGYRPSESTIAQAMRQQYPGDAIQWEKAIKKTTNDSSVFNNSFHIPVSWTVIYDRKEDRPNVSTQAEKWDWIDSQSSLLEKINELNIPKDKFHWTVNKIIHTREDGSKVPAIKAIGMATILCVLDTSV